MNNKLEKYTSSIWFKIACAAAILFVFYLLAGFLFPVFLAIALAFALYPLQRFFERLPIRGGKISMNRVVAIALSFVVLFIFLYFIVEVLILPMFAEANRLLQNLPQLSTTDGKISIKAFLDPATGSQLPSNLVALIDKLLSTVTGYLIGVAENLISSTFAIASNLIGLIVVPFLSFYFLKDWQPLRDMVVDIFPLENQEKAKSILDEMGEVLRNYVSGMGKLCIIMSIVIMVATYLMGHNYPLVLGFIAVLSELVPVLGPVAGSVPAIFLAYSQSPMLALQTAIFYFVVYQIDAQYIMPNVMGKSINLHPVLIILAVIVGAQLFGITGLIFAVPVAALVRVLYENLWHMGEEIK